MLSEKISNSEIVSAANHGANLYNTKISKQIHFLLCESCLWSASYLRRNYGSTISKCPVCNKGRVEAIPISKNDVYRFDYDPKRGIALEFSILEEERDKVFL